MTEIVTARLVLRPLTAADVAGYLAYRNDPDTLQWLGSRRPLTVEAATASIELMAARPGPTIGDWYRLGVWRAGRLIGDVSTIIRPGGGIAEVGYVLATAERGNGYAAEAAAALVDHLISEHAVQRIEASLAPDNVASMRVLESIGMRFECVARSGFDLDGVWEDDLRYAMTAGERAAWVGRQRTRPGLVELVEIDVGNARQFDALATHYSQRRLVAPMRATWRDVLFHGDVDGVPVEPWMRGIVADRQPAGFMLCSRTFGDRPGWVLWRLLIDREHQRRRIGEVAIGLLAQELARRSVPNLYVTFVGGPGSPARFYEQLGFVRTGAVVDGETEAVLDLTTWSPA